MKQIYFVTEGVTDQIVLEEIVARFLGGVDFESYPIQPPSSAYAVDLDCRLSEGWRGVFSWCQASDPNVAASRARVLNSADLVVIHLDADVGLDAQCPSGRFGGLLPPARELCDHVRAAIVGSFGGGLPPNVVICVPSIDLESWVLCCMFPVLADQIQVDIAMPFECYLHSARELSLQSPQFTRRSAGRIRKVTSTYRSEAESIAAGWMNCGRPSMRCEEAVKFEDEVAAIFPVR